MSFEDCARTAAGSLKRAERAARKSRKSRRDLVAGTALGAYQGGRISRLELDWIAGTQPPNIEVQMNARHLRARARELARNNPYARQYFNLLTSNVIGPRGFGHQGQIRNNDRKLAKPLNDKVEESFAEWSEQVTLDGKFSLVSLEHQLVRGLARDGEIFARLWRDADLPCGLALEPIDPDVVDENIQREANKSGTVNAIRMGIEIDAKARPVAFWVRPGPYEWTRFDTPIRIPADQIIHVYDPDRVNQSRGVTWLANVMLPLHHLGQYSMAELVGARVHSANMGIWQRKEGLPGDTPENVANEGNRPIPEEVTPGMFMFAPEGYQLAPFTPEHPTGNFPPFIKQMLREVSSGLQVSYNALANDLENVNYSSMRSGLLIERETWKREQQNWISRFRRRLYREWMSQALLIGKATGGDEGLVLDSRPIERLLAVRWQGRGWDWVDPLKDAEASVLAIQSGLASRTAVLAEQGEDFEQILDELSNEKELANEQNVSIDGPDPRPDAAAGLTGSAAADAQAAAAAGNKALTNGHGRMRASLRRALIER